MAELYSKTSGVSPGWQPSPQPGMQTAAPAPQASQSGAEEFKLPSTPPAPAPVQGPKQEYTAPELEQTKQAFEAGAKSTPRPKGIPNDETVGQLRAAAYDDYRKDKGNALQIAANEVGGARRTGPTAPPENKNLVQQRDWHAYGGTGEAGSGFENFERYLTANQGAIKKWQTEREQGAMAAQEDARRLAAGAGSQWQAGLAGGTTTPPSVAGGLDSATQIALAKEAAALRAELAALNTRPEEAPEILPGLVNSILGSGHVTNRAADEGKKAAAEARLAEIDGLLAPKPAAPTPSSLEAAIAAEQQHSDLVAAKNFYEGETAKNMAATAEEVATRANELTQGYEGIAAGQAAEGKSLGSTMLNAALLGSGQAGEIGRRVGKGAAEVGRLVEDTGNVAQATQQGALDTSAAQIESYKKLLGDLSATSKRVGKTGPSRSWADYMGPGGTGPAGGFITNLLLNPAANLYSVPNEGFQRGATNANLWENKNVGRGVGSMLGITGGGGGGAYFSAWDQDVYESMTDEEIHELERMNSGDQRAWINARKKQIGSKTPEEWRR